MTDAEALQIADKIDLWILNGRDCGPMRTLRAAIEMAVQVSGHVRLHRPAGFGVDGVWIERDQVVRLSRLLRAAAAA